MEHAELGYCIHACIYRLGVDSNAFVGTALIDAYAICSYVDGARQVLMQLIIKTWFLGLR